MLRPVDRHVEGTPDESGKPRLVCYTDLVDELDFEQLGWVMVCVLLAVGAAVGWGWALGLL